MNKKWNGRKIFHKCVLVLLIIAMGDFLFSGRSSVGEGEGEHFSWKEVFAARAQEGVLNIWLPSFAFADKGSASGRGRMPAARIMKICRRKAGVPMKRSCFWKGRASTRKAKTGMRWRCRRHRRERSVWMII